MKILFVNIYTGIQGGIGYYVNALARKLNQKGHETYLIHGGQLGQEKTFDRYYRLPELWDNLLALSNSTKRKLDNIVEDCTPDIIYFHKIENGKAIDYLADQAPAVRYVHDYQTVDPDGKMLLRNPVEPNTHPLSISCFFRAYTRKTMPRNPVKAVKAYMRAKNSLEATRHLKRIIVASEYMKNTLVRNGVGQEKIDVIPYFVDYIDEGQHVDEDKRSILYSGRIIDGKGLDELLSILKFVKQDFVLDVVGSGPDEELFAKKAKELDLSDKVIFRGWVKHENLPQFYQKASVLIMPSVWPEPFGICGIEAAFFGKPTIAFNVGGIPEWLADGVNGYLIRPYDRREMADKIDMLLRDGGKAESMGKAGRKIVEERFLPEAHLDRLLNIFNELC
ncbi:glycosyltransferase family 4 protein [Candidatus Omnitrophota bacterium]